MRLNISKIIAVTALSTITSLGFASDRPSFIFPINQKAPIASSAIYQTLLNSYAIRQNRRGIIQNKRSINDLNNRIETLESTPPTSEEEIENAITLAVDCSTQTVSDVLASAPPAADLTLEITGSCLDNLVITRDNVTLIGTGIGDSITYNGTEIIDNAYRENITNTITVIGATNLVIDNLTIGDALTNGFSTGLRLLNNASALLRNSTVENNIIPIWASHASSIQINDSIIRDNASYSLLITDGAVAELRGNNDLSGDNNVAGMGIYRSGTVRIQNGFTSVGSNNSDAIQVFHGSQFRSERGALVVNGSIGMGFLAQVDFRGDTTINGNMNVSSQSVARLVARGGANADVNGSINIDSLGYLEIDPRFPGTSTIDGGIFCNGFGAVTSINPDPNSVSILDNDPFGTCN